MSEAEKNLSPIRIFQQVQHFIEKVNTAPLTPGIIKFNKDEANEIGADDESGFPFARIDTGFPESNDQLLFALDFYNSGVALGYSGGDSEWRKYEELGETDEKVSRVLTSVMTALSNGQLKVLLTCTDDERIQAVELIYRKPRQRQYDAIGTVDMFQPSRKLKNRELTTTLFSNNADIKEVSIDIPKAQLLMLPDVDIDAINEISRKNIVDLSEPLTPEILKQNIDIYAEKVGERASAKVSAKYDNFEKNIGVSGMSTWELFVYYARWRHIELMVWGFAMLMAHNWVNWSLAGVNPAILLIGASLVPLYIFRNRYPYPQILYLFAPIGYALFAVGAAVFLQNFTSHWISWVIAFFAAISIAENIFFDIYFIRRKILDKIYKWSTE